MLCPVCKVDLKMSERQGIEIDYCPNCRGVWLDRGELDKIIDRSLEYEQRIRASGPAPRQTPSEFYDDDDYKRKNDASYREPRDTRPVSDTRDVSDNDRRYEKRRKGSFLDDIFDIFD